MAVAEAVGPRSGVGDATGIEAKECVVLLPLGHGLKAMPEPLDKRDTRAARPARVENDCPAERRVI